ncbi:hypothetical protein ACWCQZ_46130 [Streptomyces sp. NPDC002285]
MKPQTPKTAELEDQLRAALAARAALVTARSLQPEAPPRATRLAWRRLLPLLAVGVAAAAVVTAVTFPHHPSEQARPTETTTPRRVNLHGLSFEAPHGWSVWQPEQGTHACVQPPGVPHDMDHCWSTGIQVATQTGDHSGDSALDNGWQTQPFCWTPDGRANFSDPITSSHLVAQATRLISGQRASYGAWRVTCRSGQKFTARQWWIPRHQLSVRAYRLDPRQAPLADRLVSSITLGKKG